MLIVLVGARVTAAVWAAMRNTHGDYYAAMPGAYVRAVNPTLWDSPDLQGAWGYHLDTYFHGPTQYLTLYPVAYLDSYAQIAAVLLPIYAVALGVMFWATTRVAARWKRPDDREPAQARCDAAEANSGRGCHGAAAGYLTSVSISFLRMNGSVHGGS